MGNETRAAIKEWADRVVLNLHGFIDLMKEPEEGIITFESVASDYEYIHIHSGVYDLAEALGLDVSITKRFPIDKDDPWPYRHSVVYRGIEFYEIRSTDKKVRRDEE